MKKSTRPIIEHLTDFLDWLDIEKGLSAKSQENYSRFLNRFFYWLKVAKLTSLKPHDLDADHVWKYRVFLSRNYQSKTNKPLKKSTQNYYLIALRALLSYFSSRDILSLPVDKIKLSKDKKERSVKFLNNEQLKKLLQAPDVSVPQGLRDRTILEVLFSTGMRIAELVSLDREQIKIRPGVDELELGIIGKGSRPRTVYLSKRALSWLTRYLEERESDNEKPLFINYRSRKGASSRLTPRAIEKSFKKYSIIAGIPITTTPHVLRHTFATDLLNKGVDLRAVQEFLGHKNITATQIYTHVTNKRLRDIHKKFHGDEDLN